MRFEDREVNQYERKIIGYLLRDRLYVKKSITCGMNTTWFSSDELKSLFKQIVKAYENYGLELSKRLYMDEVKSNNQIEIDEYSDYGKFYDWAYQQYDGEDNFEFYISKFKEIGINAEIALNINNYANNFTKLGGKEALDLFKRKINYLTYEGDEREIKVLDYVKDSEEQIEDIKNRKEHPEIYTGIKTGYPILDEHFKGFHKGTISLIVGVTGTGKTTFSSNIAANQCFKMDKNVVIFTLEDSALVWAHKLTSAETGIPFSDILDGTISDENFKKIVSLKKGRKHNSKYVLFEMQPRKYTVNDIEEEIERKVIDAGEWRPDIIYIDQLSLVAPTVSRGQRYDIEFGDVTKSCARLAKSYNIPIVITGQINRSAIRNIRNERVVDIQLENISQSNQPSEDARCVLAIQTNHEDEDLDEKDYKIKILKQSYGRAGVEIDLKFKKAYLSFTQIDIAENEIANDGVIRPEMDLFMDEEERKRLEIIINQGFGIVEENIQNKDREEEINNSFKSISEFLDDDESNNFALGYDDISNV